jgi:Flp pilus assembly pilin Flp
MIEMTDKKRKGQKGVTTVEYAIMLVLIALVVATFGKSIGTEIKNVFQDTVTELQK